jgi:hypothetical protein
METRPASATLGIVLPACAAMPICYGAARAGVVGEAASLTATWFRSGFATRALLF